MKTIYNLDTVIKIVVRDFRECDSLMYQKGSKKTFFSREVPDGFYVRFDFSSRVPYTKEELERGDYSGIKFKIKDDKVYFRPDVIIYFQGEHKYSQVFDVYDEALKFAKDIQSKSITNPLIIE